MIKWAVFPYTEWIIKGTSRRCSLPVRLTFSALKLVIRPRFVAVQGEVPSSSSAWWFVSTVENALQFWGWIVPHNHLDLCDQPRKLTWRRCAGYIYIKFISFTTWSFEPRELPPDLPIKTENQPCWFHLSHQAIRLQQRHAELLCSAPFPVVSIFVIIARSCSSETCSPIASLSDTKVFSCFLSFSYQSFSVHRPVPETPPSRFLARQSTPKTRV